MIARSTILLSAFSAWSAPPRAAIITTAARCGLVISSASVMRAWIAGLYQRQLAALGIAHLPPEPPGNQDGDSDRRQLEQR